MKQYDWIVIGSGAGLMVIEAALSQGLSCALIEKAKLGGTCLTKGCIPSKMLVYPADLIREAQAGGRVGLAFAPPAADWPLIAKRMWRQINYSQIMESNLRTIDNLDLYRGTAAFTGPRSLVVRLENGQESDIISGQNIVIAAGARSFIPKVDGLEAAGYVIPETFFGDRFPQKLWKSLLIVGGGAIGAEFAHIFSALGTQVSVVEMKPHLLASEEEEISVFVERQMAANGIAVHTNSRLVAAGRKGSSKTVTIESSTSGEQKTLACEEIFLAGGVRSNADWLGLEKTQVKIDESGWIITDSKLATTQPGIWALGDINGLYQFRHKANQEAEVLVHNLLFAGEKQKEMKYRAVPWAIFTHPQVAHVGLTEREARQAGHKVHIGRNHYSEIAGGGAMGFGHGDADDGFVKIIVGDDKKILGAHVVGPHASILVQSFVYLMNSGLPCQNVKVAAAGSKSQEIKDLRLMCPQLGTLQPISDSMVIHPSLNELTAWVIDKIEWD